jgi:hypothetical protein
MDAALVVEIGAMDSDVVTHHRPVWRHRADFILSARIEDEILREQWRREQLWGRRVADNVFELCCIPFFVPDLALGDEVETAPEGDRQYVVRRVIRRSGRRAFQIWFQDPAARTRLEEDLANMGCLIERRFEGSNLLAVDAADEDLASRVLLLLERAQDRGEIDYQA